MKNKEAKSMEALKIAEFMRRLAKKYDYIVVEDIHTKNPCIYGTYANKSVLESGGGKSWIVWKDDIKRDAVPDGAYCISVNRLAQRIYEYFN